MRGRLMSCGEMSLFEAGLFGVYVKGFVIYSLHIHVTKAEKIKKHFICASAAFGLVFTSGVDGGVKAERMQRDRKTSKRSRLSSPHS